MNGINILFLKHHKEKSMLLLLLNEGNKCTISCLSMTCRMSDFTLSNVVSVLWLVLYADWFGSMRL